LGGLLLGVALAAQLAGQRAEEDLDQLEDRLGTDVLREVGPAGLENTDDFGPLHGRWARLVTRSNASTAKGSGGSPRSATTITPRGCSNSVALATFGGQVSVAAMAGGNLAAPASTSPLPVWISSAADARPRR
jgi:hypothetical protein